MTAILLALLAQNVVSDDQVGRTAEPVAVGAAETEALIAMTSGAKRTASRTARKLAAHAREFLDGYPWKPLHVTHGISGYEPVFDHPDRMFLVLAAALPWLEKEDGARVAAFLRERLDDAPPWSAQGFDRGSGRAREHYAVPEQLRVGGRGSGTGALGIYAFWSYVYRTGDRKALDARWSRLLERADPLLGGAPKFDLKRRHDNDEAQRLNGDLAGMIGLARLARMRGDVKVAERAAARARDLLTLRVNLDRVNPAILEPTKSTTGHLHVFKLARYCDLVPEVARALRDHTDGLAAVRLRTFRRRRNGWFLAWGERIIGGENYISPPHVAHALFAGAAGVEEIDVELFVDVPWCRGDLYFMEKCVRALWATAGRPWEKVD